VRGWAFDFLSQPWPAITFVVLAALAATGHRRLAERLGWARWPTLGLLLSLAAVLTLTLPPGPGMPIGVPGVADVDQCVGSLSDAGALWDGLISTTDRGERVGNIAMFVPLTFFAVLASRRPWLVAAGGVLISGAIELTQSVMHLGRECVGYDWVNNAIGAVLGVLLGVLATRVATRPHTGVGESPPR
jgi:VanZ like family